MIAKPTLENKRPLFVNQPALPRFVWATGPPSPRLPELPKSRLTAARNKSQVSVRTTSDASHRDYVRCVPDLHTDTANQE